MCNVMSLPITTSSAHHGDETFTFTSNVRYFTVMQRFFWRNAARR